MRFWWLTDSARLAAERAVVEALARDEDWLEFTRWKFDDARFAAEAIISAHGRRYPVRLIYPDQFPQVPPWVEPQDDARWSTHQYGKGVLCLELRPDNWTAEATGADVLRSAHNLLVTEDPLGEGGERAPSDHRIGQVQAYDWGLNPVLIGQRCAERIEAGIALDLVGLRWMAADEVWPILVHDAEDRLLLRRPPGADIHNWRFDIPVFVSTRSAPAGVPDRAALVAAADLQSDMANLALETNAAIILFTGEADIAGFHLMADGATHRRRVLVLPDESGARSARSTAAECKRVAIVGAGSIGSKLAESLVRSGLGLLTLIDGDVLLPDNLERHALEWRDVGFRKVNGLKRRLLAIAPGADIRVVDNNLNWQRSAKSHAWQVEAVADCSVIVDATGDPATALFLGALADANERPFVSVEVFEGGLGALVATALPDRDPPFVDGRATFLAWCDEQGVAPPEPGPRRYEMLAGDGAPIVADDAAVTMTAGHAARVILDIVDGAPAPSDSAWLLLGYSRHWLFDGHGHTIRLSVGERCPGTSGEDAEARAFALDLFKEWLDAAKAAG